MASVIEGRLFYVVGEAGAGEGGLLHCARGLADGRHPVVFAHRYVTRPAGAGGENHVALTESEFALRKRHGFFVMDWESDGVRYGIGAETNYWLAMGLSVVVKGSRGYLAQALKAYPDMTVVWVSAAHKLVAAGAAPPQRGPARHAAMRAAQSPLVPGRDGCRIVHISSGSSMADAARELLAVLERDGS